LWRVIRQQKAGMDVGTSNFTGGHRLNGTPQPPATATPQQQLAIDTTAGN
jgi:hypothetical protein